MRAERWIISSIFTALLVAFTIAPAFADVTTWSALVNGLSTTATNAHNIDYVRVGTDTQTDEYVFQMALDALPTEDTIPEIFPDNLIYGIYLGGPDLAAPSIGSRVPTAMQSDDSFFAIYRANGGFHLLQNGVIGDIVFNYMDTEAAPNTLEWRMDTSSLASTSWFYGAVMELDHKWVMDVTGTAAVTPIPAAAWLLGSGIIGLAGIMRRNGKGASGQRA